MINLFKKEKNCYGFIIKQSTLVFLLFKRMYSSYIKKAVEF